MKYRVLIEPDEDGVFVAEKDSLVTKCPSKFSKKEST